MAVTLEHLREKHDRAVTPAIARARRKQARDLAASLNAPVPEWACERERPRPIVPARPRYGRRREVPVVATRVRAMELDTLLSEWRRAGEGRIVRVHQGGVELHELGQPVRRFASTSAALEALTAPYNA